MFTRKPRLQLEKFAINGAKRLLGLRRIEWVILRLKTPQSWGLQGAFAFLRDLKFGTTDG
jgi:hypothetical protein